jgi:hypothetical protein
MLNISIPVDFSIAPKQLCIIDFGLASILTWSEIYGWTRTLQHGASEGGRGNSFPAKQLLDGDTRRAVV